MADKNYTKAKNLSGPSIYTDNKEGTVFYDFLSKDAYIISDRNAYKYDNFKTFVILGWCVLVAAFFYFKMHWALFILLAILIYVIGRFYFQKKCLDDCALLEGFVPKKRELFVYKYAREFSYKRFIQIILLTILMLVLCVFNVFKFKSEEFIYYGYIIMSILTFVFLIFMFISLFIKIKNNKNEK